jgi:hypothetical protein
MKALNSIFKRSLVALVLLVSFALHSQAQLNPAYDPGPDFNTPMGRELVNLMAEFPDYADISVQMMGEQKFRPVFGPVTWRMLLKPNSIKILFQGQDATHIAEAAGRPATAGFGGRAMDVAKYLGVGPGAGFINAYASTIQGQYGTFQSPVVVVNQDGSPKDVIYSSFVSNELWAMTMNADSPIARFRNKLISWIIRNNPESLKMVILFGGASRDAFASFVESKGGKVGTRTRPESLKYYRVPKMDTTGGGGNNEVAYPLSVDGKDLYSKVMGKKVNYIEPQEPAKDYVSEAETARKKFKAEISTYFKDIKFLKGGLGGSGLLNAAQLGGYDIDDKMYINGKKTISLKGLKISDDYTVDHDILVRTFPHPTSLSMMSPSAAAKAVGEPLKKVRPYFDRGFYIPADEGFVSKYESGEAYAYARADMGPETYDFGAPASRMVNVSSAVRAGKDAIIFGTRDKIAFVNRSAPQYDQQKVLYAMAAAKPSHYPSSLEMWTTRPSGEDTRFVFDPGPGEKYAAIMKKNIPLSLVNQYRANRDYAHYRGTFKSPKVFILADPHGYDDLITARALTGARGQYLNGLMEDLGVKDQYLILKTVPFGKEADAKKWKDTVEQTRTYREAVIREVFKDSKPGLIIADGEDAIAELHRILGKSVKTPIIDISRDSDAPTAGLEKAITAIKAIPEFKKQKFNLRMVDLPRSHLSFYARWWEGTSGDRVITSLDPKYRDKAFAMVAPKWAYEQHFEMTRPQVSAVEKLKRDIEAFSMNPVEILTDPVIDNDDLSESKVDTAEEVVNEF